MACIALFMALTIEGSACRSACSSPQGKAVELSVSGTNADPVNPVSGVNTNFFGAPETVNNTQVWKAARSARIPMMRFPGGRGNWYDWRTGAIRVPGNIELDFGQRGNSRTVPLDAFMSRALSAGIPVSYVLNIMDSPKSIRELARRWERTNAPVRWVEMGNEYYSSKLASTIGGAPGYLSRSRQALRALRAGGYQGRVGLVAALPESETGLGGPGSDQQQVWNQEIAKADTSDFAAIILHYYPSLEGSSLDRVYGEAPSRLSDTIKRARKIFPAKQVWITEWNLGKPATSPEINTLGHALFDLRILKVMLDAQVDLAGYHVLTGPGWELLGPDRFTYRYDGKSDARLVKRVPYFAFQMFGEAQSNGARYIPTGKRTGDIEYMAFRTRDELRILAWTSTKETRTVRVEMDGNSLEFSKGERLQGKLDSTNGSFLRIVGTDRTTNEDVKPVAVGSPRIEGPGAVLLKFSLKNQTSHAKGRSGVKGART